MLFQDVFDNTLVQSIVVGLQGVERHLGAVVGDGYSAAGHQRPAVHQPLDTVVWPIHITGQRERFRGHRDDRVCLHHNRGHLCESKVQSNVIYDISYTG